jgi:hypothetical protein
MSQDRATFQQLAEARLVEARLLLAHGHSSGAYYLAGYAIECALKAKIAADFRKDEIPELKRVQNIYTHDLSALLALANLREQLDSERETNPRLYQRWTAIKDWSEKRVMWFRPRWTLRLYWMRSAVMKECYNGCGIAGRIKVSGFDAIGESID